MGYPALWVVIHREHGLRFVIYTTDHDPAHVHIFGDGELKVNIVGSDGLPEMVVSRGMKTGGRGRVMDVMKERLTEFLDRWRAILGGEE